MRRFLRKLLLTLVVTVLGLLLALRLAYGGGGEDYEDLSGSPLLPESALELVAELDVPPGNIAVSSGGRMFLTIHPESRPGAMKLVERVDGSLVAYPDEATQASLLTPLGVRIDSRNRLWVLDHARHGTGQARLLAFDLASNQQVQEVVFDRDAAPLGSMLNDLAIDADAETIFVSDVSFFRRRPAILVIDAGTGSVRRILQGHHSVEAQDWLIRTSTRPMTWFADVLTLRAGVDGIALSPDGEWLFYAAMNHTHAFRLRIADIRNTSLNSPALAANAEAFGRKPLSDGLIADGAGNLLITDVEHGAVHRLSPSGELETLIRSSRIRWADGMSDAADGSVYLTDSALQDVMFRTHEQIAAAAPYHIYRFRPPSPGTSSIQ